MGNSTKNSEDTVSWIMLLFVIIGILSLFYKEWTNNAVKARAFEKIEDNSSLSTDEALEESETERDDAIDVMIESQNE